MYRTGTGVEKDLVEAYKWLSLAAEKGHGVRVRDLLGDVMTPAQVAEAKKRALDYQEATGKGAEAVKPAESAQLKTD